MKELFITLGAIAMTCFIFGTAWLILNYKKVLYRILRNDMIEKFRVKHGGEFVNDVLKTFGLKLVPIYDFMIKLDAEDYKEQVRKMCYKVEGLQRQINDIKNPPAVPKFKIGQTVGKFAISKIGTSDCNPYNCIDKDGNLFPFTENEIEAMMKLNPESK